MSTKLVVSLDGLLLTNLNTIVDSRNIDEVILVGSSTEFNNLDSTQRTQISNTKSSGIGSASLSVAFNNQSSAELTSEFYDFLSLNNIDFFNDPGLQSLTSGLVLTSTGTETLSSITDDKLVAFNTSTLSDNSLYVENSSLTLGSSFALKPTISFLSAPSYLDDLSGSISVNISAAQFAALLSEDDSSILNVTDLANLIIQGDSSNPTPLSTVNSGGHAPLVQSDFTTNYDGTNRLGNLVGVSSTQDTVPTGSGPYVYASEDLVLSVLQALKIPLMGVAPGSNYTVTLEDTSENLSLGLKAFTSGQIASFNSISITDSNPLLLDPATLKALDTARIPASWTSHKGTVLSDADSSSSQILLRGTLSELASNGFLNSDLDEIVTSFSSDSQNLLSLISTIDITGTITDATGLSEHKSAIEALSDSGLSFTTDLSFSSAFSSTGITTSEFYDLAEIDALTSQDLISENFPSGISISDTTLNLKSLLTHTDAGVIAVKSSIGGLTSTSDDNAQKIELSWDEYVEALTGTSFDSTDSTTWSVSGKAFQSLQNVELIVSGTASEIKDIVDTYGTSLTFPSGLVFNIVDGNSLTLTQSQLDQLDARIDGVVLVQDTSSGIATLLDNAIPTSVQQITLPNTTDTLEITFDQFRNLPTYYSDDVVIVDTEDNIVAALNEDLLDDRVTTLVVMTDTDSTTLGKATSSTSSTPDSALTVTAAAAKNILSKKIYTETDYTDGNNTSYMGISIVDRGSAIADFIGTATFPGTSTAEDLTGAIDFVEKDGGSITLNWEQQQAYTAIPNGILNTSLTTTPSLAAANLSSIMAAISDVDGDIVTQTTTLSSAISTARQTITDNDDDIAGELSSLATDNTDALSSLITTTDTAQTATLSSAISTARQTITDDASTKYTSLSSAVLASHNAVLDEEKTVAQFLAASSVVTDIVDTHANIIGSDLLGSSSALSSNIRSINVLSGDTLKLTSSQLQKLLDTEDAVGSGAVLFSGKIKLTGNLSGTYQQVYDQITDYRLALEEGFDASEYSATITPAITVAQGNSLNTAGLTMANQTYNLEDSLSALDTQATDDSTNTLKKAAAVAVDDGTITSGNFSKLNNIASVATTPITATVSGSGSSLTSGSPLGNLGDNEKISFKIATGETATAAQIAAIALLRDSDSGNYPIEFEGTAKLTGAYSTFISVGDGDPANHSDYATVLTETAGVPIELSTFATASAVMIEDLNFLLNNAEGVVTVDIEDSVDDYSLLTSTSYKLNTSNTNGKTHVVTVDFGAQTVGGATITNLNDLAGQTPITSITGSLTSVTAENVDALASALAGASNSTVSFSLKTDSDGLLTVSQATGLLSHTDQTAHGVSIVYGGGITGDLSDYVSAGSETVSELMLAVISEDGDTALTVADSQLTTAANIKDLNALATLSSGIVTATVVADKGNLLGGSGGATLGTGSGDAITITLNDAASATEYKTLSGKTSGDVTLSAGFSGILTDFVGDTAITSNLDDAFDVTANRNKTITFTDSDLGAAAVAKLNILDSEAKHTGGSALIAASITADLTDFADLATDATDLITIEISDALTAANVAALNTLKAKTGASITASISGAASALKSLDTDTSDSITISITGSSNEVEDVLLTTNKTSSLALITIAGIEDVQAKIAGTSFTDSSAIDAAILNIKTQINPDDASSVTDITMVDRLYDEVTGAVVLPSGTTVTVANAIPISTFTVTDSDNSITYDIEDSAGTSDVAGLATATSAVNTAIANADSVTATAALTVAQAVEMLGGVSNGVAGSKFDYDIDDGYSAVTEAEGFELDSSDADEVNKKIAHENADNVTLTPGTVENLISNVDGLTDGTHTYTVRDTLDKLSNTSTTGLDTLLSKATSIQIGSSDSDGNFVAATIDADVSANRTKFRTIVSNAVDGDTNRPITATITGTGVNLKGGSDANPINSTEARVDVITLTVEAPGGSDTGYSVEDIATFKGLTSSSTITVTGGIEDSVNNLMANDTTRSDNYIIALNATENAALLLDTFTPSATTSVTRLNNLFGFSEGTVTGTITDNSGTGGQYLLSTAVTTLSPGDTDSITVNIGTSTADDDTITELGLLAAKAGVDSIQGTLTLNSTRVGDINSDNNLTSSNNKIDYVLSNEITVDAAAALITKTAAPGSVDFDTSGIEDTYDKFVDDADSPSELSDNFKKVIGADSGSINDPDTDISISTALTLSKHIDTLNLLTSSSDHTGAITAAVQGNQSLLSTITGSNTNTTITATGALNISQYDTIKATTANSVQFSASGSITDEISTLYDADLAEDRHADLHEAISGDKDMNIVVEDAEITSNWDQVNAIAGGEYTGTISATLKGTAAQLTNSGAGWSNLNSTDSAIAFDLTSGTASVAQIAILAGDTKNTNIAMTGAVISNDLDDLITDDGTNSDGSNNFDTAISHTTAADISVSSTVSVTGAAEIRQINKLIDEAEGNIILNISDNSNVSLGALPITGAADGSTIQIELGTITASNDNFSAVSALGAQLGITQITAIFDDVEDSHITHLDSLSGFGSTDKFNITFNLKTDEDAISLPQAAILAAASGKAGGSAIDFGTAGISASTSQLLNDSSDGASTALSAVTAKDANVNITISDTVETEAEITALNLADTNTAGTVNGSVQTTATLAKTITTTNAKINVVVDDDGTFTLEEFGALDDNVHTDNSIHLSGVGNDGGGASILDSLGNLATFDSELAAAVAHDSNIAVALNTGDITTEADILKLNTAANIVGDGGITATIKGTSNLLTADSGDGGGTGYANLSTSDAISFEINSGNTSLAHINVLANDTSEQIAISGSGVISAGLNDLVEINDASAAAPKTLFTTALANTTGESVTLSSAVTISTTAEIKKLNYLLSSVTGVEGNLVATVTDSDDSLLLDVGDGRPGLALTGAASGDQINIDLGTFAATTNFLSKLNDLAGLEGVSEITATITGMSAARISELADHTNIDNDSKFEITYQTTGQISFANAVILTGKTGLTTDTSIDFGAAGILGATTDFVTGSATSSDYQAILAKDANVNIEVSDTIQDSTDVAALNIIDNGASDITGTTGTVTATVTVSATDAASLATNNANTTVSITSENIGLEAWEDVQATTGNDITLTADGSTALIQDNSTNFGLHTDIVDAIIADDDAAPFEMTGTITSDDDVLILKDALNRVGTGGVKATVTSSYSNISSLTTASTSDNITFTVSDNLSPAQLVAIVTNQTSKSTITLGDSSKLSAGIGAFMADATTLHDDLDDSIGYITNAAGPSINISTEIELASTADITKINSLMATGTVGGVTATISDTDGAIIHNGTVNLTTGSNDVITVTTGTYNLAADSNTQRTSIIALATQAGIATLSGTVGSVTSDDIDAFVAAADFEANTDNLGLTTSQATNVNAGASLAERGNITYTGGITSTTLNDFTHGTEPYAITTPLTTILTEDDSTPLTYTGSAIDDARDISRLNSAAAATDGVVTASIDANATLLSDLGTGSADQITINLDSSISNSAFATLNGKTGATITFDTTNGKLSDALSGFMDGDSRSSGLTGAISNDGEVKIEITGDAIETDDFSKLQTIAGADTDGAITASVTGTATDISANLSNLAAADGDQISFTVSSHSGNDKAEILQVAALTAIASNSVDVANITDSYSNVSDVLSDDKIDHSDAAVTINGDTAFTVSNYNLIKDAVGTLSFNTIKGSYSDLNTLGASVDLSSKTIEVTTALSKVELVQLTDARNLTLATLTYTLDDSGATLAGMSADQLSGATSIAVDDSTSVSNLETIRDNSGLALNDKITYTSGVTDVASVLGGDDTDNILDGKALTLSGTATADLFRSAITNAGGGSVSGAVVETDPDKLANDSGAVTGATSITLTIQSDNQDFTGKHMASGIELYDGQAATRITYNLDGHTGVLFTIDNIDGSTVSAGSGGTYIIKDAIGTIITANANDGGGADAVANSVSKFKALYGSTEIHATGLDVSNADHDLGEIGNTTVNGIVVGNTDDMSAITTTAIKVTLSSDTTITDTIGERLKTVTTVELSGVDTDLTIEGDALDNSDNEWSAFTTLTGLDSQHNLVITDGTANAGGTIDVYGLSTLTNIDAVSITAGAGADTINLSPTLTSSGTTTIDMGSAADDADSVDAAADKIFLGVKTSSYSSVDDAVLKYSTINNFDVARDRLGLYYYDFDDSPISAIGGGNKRTSSGLGGVQTLTADRTFIEQDSDIGYTSSPNAALSNYNTVSEIQTLIADSISTFSDTGGSNRLMFAHYDYVQTDNTNYAIINAADLTGASSTDNLLASESSFKVVGIAQLADVASESLGTLGGYNLEGTKADTLGGYS